RQRDSRRVRSLEIFRYRLASGGSNESTDRVRYDQPGENDRNPLVRPQRLRRLLASLTLAQTLTRHRGELVRQRRQTCQKIQRMLFRPDSICPSNPSIDDLSTHVRLRIDGDV